MAWSQLSALGIKRGASRKWSTETHIHYYFINLMVFDLVQAAGESTECMFSLVMKLICAKVA